MLRRKREIVAPAHGEKTEPRNSQESIAGKRFGAIAAFCIVLLVGAVAFAANAGYGFYQTDERSTAESETDNRITEAPPQAPAAPAPTPPQQQSMQAELITITPGGFEPNVIKRPVGRVLLAVVNRSEQSSMTLRLERENGAVLGQAQLPRNRRQWRVPVTLAAGRYRIVDANRSSVFCNIEITP